MSLLRVWFEANIALGSDDGRFLFKHRNSGSAQLFNVVVRNHTFNGSGFWTDADDFFMVNSVLDLGELSSGVITGNDYGVSSTSIEVQNTYITSDNPDAVGVSGSEDGSLTLNVH